MKFNSRFDHNISSKFRIGNQPVKEVDSYCYLGIEIHNSGSFALARTELKKKAMRALYSLKRTVNRSKLSFRALTTLFDSLIKPIVLYGAPIYTPNMSIIKHISKYNDHKYNTPNGNNQNQSNIPNKISLLNSEKVHLHFLKWALGVNRKASNVGVWGESGRYPLVYECINQTLKYVQRLQNRNDGSLISLAFKEQRDNKLDWYRGIEPILTLDPSFSRDHVTAFHQLNNNSVQHNLTKPDKPQKEEFLIHNGFKKRIPPQSILPICSKIFTTHIIMKLLKLHFKESWFSVVNTSPKLEFYKEIKPSFIKEGYLDIVKNYTDRANITRLRISAHRLEIELGRRTKTP
ncbi:MAG: hypothetical protein GY816_15245, partial [Cytophagales bacterium]|nr:hypothetical protein [Cytophagales bacterium]